MKLLFAFAATALVANAAVAEPAKPTPQILERDAQGRATKVRIDGQDYTVCTTDGQDGCINPREAGLPMGSPPLADWPGRPASEIKAEKARLSGGTR